MAAALVAPILATASLARVLLETCLVPNVVISGTSFIGITPTADFDVRALLLKWSCCTAASSSPSSSSSSSSSSNRPLFPSPSPSLPPKLSSTIGPPLFFVSSSSSRPSSVSLLHVFATTSRSRDRTEVVTLASRANNVGAGRGGRGTPPVLLSPLPLPLPLPLVAVELIVAASNDVALALAVTLTLAPAVTAVAGLRTAGTADVQRGKAEYAANDTAAGADAADGDGNVQSLPRVDLLDTPTLLLLLLLAALPELTMVKAEAVWQQRDGRCCPALLAAEAGVAVRKAGAGINQLPIPDVIPPPKPAAAPPAVPALI
mmetsp:Transcript_37942/g.77223  ORF Transcript_37942/g.77223 Transcript_37942/m.77223 type:complete len:317 (+) Transcript_37942:3200-4150(+)